MIKKLSKSGGFTLIEIIIVLAIIGMLAGILAPTMVKYVQSAKLRRATGDVKMIGTAMGNFYNDLGEWPVWKDGTAMDTGGAVATAWSILLFGDINTTTGAITSDNAAEGSGWTDLNFADATLTSSGAQHLWLNTPVYPTGATLKYAWRGPYLEQFRTDPWGNNYAVNTIQLWPANEQGNAPCYVICAGPNKAFETTYAQPGPNMIVGGDDIVFRLK
ncbi:MAG: prepilin-type N-terminal cleavage/methylation domain-containing protein [Candidatus Brocadiaceae bacterium]|nr:prepilin-type N-terminal cleavage/methylation domain-containing protein [Candidatus Brocadiaceae bacterium]